MGSCVDLWSSFLIEYSNIQQIISDNQKPNKFVASFAENF